MTHPHQEDYDTGLAALAILVVMTAPAWAPGLLWWLLMELSD